LACWLNGEGAGQRDFRGAVGFAAKNSMSLSSTGPLRLIFPTTRGTGVGPDRAVMMADSLLSIPSSAVAKRLE